jgi:hypothetical protein
MKTMKPFDKGSNAEDGLRAPEKAGSDAEQMRDYRKRVDQMKHRFDKEQRKRRKKKEKEAVSKAEADEKYDYIALTQHADAKAKAVQAEDGEHLFDVFKRLFEEKLQLYIDRETKYQEKKDSVDEA